VNLSAQKIASRRIRAQLLVGSRGLSATEVVSHLGGIQAQDYSGAKWSIGIRLSEAGEERIEKAIASGAIVRTWSYRGTLHLLSAIDAAWLLPLLAPSVFAANQRRYRELALDDKTFAESRPLIRRILESESRPVPRSRLCELLEKDGIRTEGQRAHYLLQRAGLEGVLCLGPAQGREATYKATTIESRSLQAMDSDQGKAKLIERYFTSHGPATIQDFSWWSGIPVSQVRRLLRSHLLPQSIFSEEKDLWAGKDQPVVAAYATESVWLLPPFDEYLLGYRNRSAVLDPAFVKIVNAGGGMMKPTLVVNGRVAGIWKQIRRKSKITIFVEPFRELTENEDRLLARAAERYGRFHNTVAELR